MPRRNSIYAPQGSGALLTMKEMFMDSGIHDTGANSFASDQNAPGLTLPKWFLITVTGLLGLIGVTFLPWSVWVTLTMLDYTNIRDVRGDVLADHKARLSALEVSRENTALQLQAISSTRFTAEQANALNAATISEMRGGFSRQDAKIESLQRDFDRNFGKPKGAIVEPGEVETVGE